MCLALCEALGYNSEQQKTAAFMTLSKHTRLNYIVCYNVIYVMGK